MVARHEGRVVFVADAIPGERVRARVVDAGAPGADSKSFWRADTVEVIEAAPERQEHVWAEASVDRAPEDRAGGAEFGHIVLAHQRELKRRVATDALRRMAAVDGSVLDPLVIEPLPGDDAVAGLGWRTRVTLHVDDDGVAGPYAARSHRVIPVESLPLASEALRSVAPLTHRMPPAASIDIVAPSSGGARVLVNEARPAREPRGRVGRPGRRGGPGHSAGSPDETIVERVGDRDFRLAERGFWQVHRLAAETLTGAVAGSIDEAMFDPRGANLDLYGGVGLLAAAVGDRFGATTRITSVESNERATDFAALNLSDWVGAQAVTARVERYVAGLAQNATATERSRQRAATIVLDPPRSGAGRAVVEQLLELEPAQLIYVACDPVAFARDTATLRAGGYELRALRGFDLFPHTHHLELVARFTR